MSKERITGEEAIIQSFLAPLAASYPGAYGLKDDCAAFSPSPGHDLVVKTDPVAEGVHFFADDRPEDIGWKALAVNVSDLAAKAAVPRAYLMALSFPEAPTRDWMRGFAEGLADAQAAFGMHLIGGDTDKRPGPITISITVFGEVTAGRMVRRATAKAGDSIYVTGVLGAGATGLALRQRPDLATAWGLTETASAAVLGAYLRPQPRLAIRDSLLMHASAAMDLSDGLAKDLGRMCKASGCGAHVRARDIPLAEATRRAIARDTGRWTDAIASGDDYEILAAVPPERETAFASMADAAGGGRFGVTRIGTFTTTLDMQIEAVDGTSFNFSRAGWDHF